MIARFYVLSRENEHCEWYDVNFWCFLINAILLVMMTIGLILSFECLTSPQFSVIICVFDVVSCIVMLLTKKMCGEFLGHNDEERWTIISSEYMDNTKRTDCCLVSTIWCWWLILLCIIVLQIFVTLLRYNGES